MEQFLNANCCWLFPMLLALQIVLLVIAVKKRNSSLFAAAPLLGIAAIALVMLTPVYTLEFYKALLRTIMPHIFAIATLISIGIRAGLRDQMPSRIPWHVLFFLWLAVYFAYVIFCIIQLGMR